MLEDEICRSSYNNGDKYTHHFPFLEVAMAVLVDAIIKHFFSLGRAVPIFSRLNRPA
jgi:hypothetical protein